MNRTDRLYALVDELRARAPGQVTAAELAARFEVAVRTIERDLLALQEAGVPIWGRRGPGGGYTISRETSLPPLNLTPAEAAAVATALAAVRSMPFAEAGRSALRKVAAVMAAGDRDGAARLLGQIRVAPVEAVGSDAVAPAIQRALLESEALALRYRDRAGRETARVVEPAGVVGTRGGWFLVGWCRLRGAPRAFRLDRIARATPTGERVTPRDLDSVMPDLPFDVTGPSLT